jgi:hypothetical protein
MFSAARLSWMHGGVSHDETLGSRIRIPVGRNQRDRQETGILLEPVGFEDDSQLYGIVSPEPVLEGCQRFLRKATPELVRMLPEGRGSSPTPTDAILPPA